MPYREKLSRRITEINSKLCIGLDPRPDKIEGDIESFLQRVIEETAPHAAAFKPNSAYFEAMGSKGVALLERVVASMPQEIPVILDCKRNDIRETQKYYARACFDALGVDAVTLNPFLGEDSLEPFLAYPEKGIYLLAVTSNPGSKDFQMQKIGAHYLFELVNAMAKKQQSMGLVVGLTNSSQDILERISDVPLLIPGLGAQGGDLQFLSHQQRKAPNLVSVSREILYPEKGSHGEAAQAFREKINAVF